MYANPIKILVLAFACLYSSSYAEEKKTVIIKANDTLSGLIYENYPNVPTTTELIQQIVADNPTAFANNNPNHLIIGRTLLLPSIAPQTNSISSETQAKLKQLEQEKQVLTEQLARLEAENTQLKSLIQSLESEQKNYALQTQQLERQIETLQAQAKLNIEAAQATASDQLNNQIKSLVEKQQTLQRQLDSAHQLANEQAAEAKTLTAQLADQKVSSHELTMALQEARNLNTRLTFDLQQVERNSNIPWILAGLAALLLIPLLWLVRRRPDSVNTTTVALENANSPSKPRKLESIPKPSTPSSNLASITLNESEIKLNIARAYLDKRNPQAATELLQEVISEGDEAQKQQAREILSFIT